MSITIPADLEARIRAKVDAGQFARVGAALAEAVGLLDREGDRQRKLETLRASIDAGNEGVGVPVTRESWQAALARVRHDFSEHRGTGHHSDTDRASD